MHTAFLPPHTLILLYSPSDFLVVYSLPQKLAGMKNSRNNNEEVEKKVLLPHATYTAPNDDIIKRHNEEKFKKQRLGDQKLCCLQWRGAPHIIKSIIIYI